MKNGIMLIDKHRGYSCNEVVMTFKNTLRQKKIGHGGTLDPMATGLLILMLGRGTRFFPYIIELDKEYRFEVEFGYATDTFDSEGKVVCRSDVKVTEAGIRDALSGFVGEIDQIPPMFSAKKIEGKPLYKLARQGKEVQRDPKRVRVYELELVSFDAAEQKAELRARVGKGTYIRAIGNDLGEKLGSYATCVSIRRTRIGPHSVEDATSFEDVLESGSTPQVIPLEYIFPHYERVDVKSSQWEDVRNGTGTRVTAVSKRVDRVRIYVDGEFRGLGQVEFGTLRPVRLVGG